MKLIIVASILASAASSLHAQTPDPIQTRTAPTSAPGPTMDQTIAFLNETLAKQAGVTYSYSSDASETIERQTYQLEGVCSVKVSSTIGKRAGPSGINDKHLQEVEQKRNNHKGTRQWVLFLDRTDPLTVRVLPEGNPQTAFSVMIAKAVFQNQPIDIVDSTHIEKLPSEYDEYGVVQTVSGKSLTIVTDNGRLIGFTPDRKIQLLGDAQTSDPSHGDWVNISRATFGSFPKVVGETLVLEKTSDSEKPFSFAYLTSQDQADRIAKALIHALVLCHKDGDAKPSLF